MVHGGGAVLTLRQTHGVVLEVAVLECLVHQISHLFLDLYEYIDTRHIKQSSIKERIIYNAQNTPSYVN